MKNGYVRLDRKILEWEWYSDANTCRVFLHLLLKANWKAGRFRGVEVPRGSLISSLGNLAGELNLTIRNVRTALNHLKSTGEVTSSQHAKFTVFTIKNYDLYQTGDTVNDRLVAGNRQASDTEVTTIEKRKNNNKLKSNYRDIVLQDEPSDDVLGNDPYANVCWEETAAHYGEATVMDIGEPEGHFHETGEMVLHQEKAADQPDHFVDVNKMDAGRQESPVISSEGSSPVGYPYDEAVAYLNQRTGKHFKSSSKEIRKLLRKRFEENFSLGDIKKVIDVKTAEWKGTRMSGYLRPSTLFGDNFEAYLNQEPVHVHGRSAPAGGQKRAFEPKAGTGFNNFDQRPYDFDLLEQQLLAAEPPAMPVLCWETMVPTANCC